MDSLDIWLFHAINSIELPGILDQGLIYWRKSFVWVPLYLFLSILLVVKQGAKLGGIITIVAIAAVGFTDFTSSSLLKPAFERSRPCQQFAEDEYILRVNCGPGKSFPSSHAANHMCLAVFLFIMGLNIKKKIYFGWLFPWALIVGFAQIYVGVHFPVDVLMGFIWGAIVGFAFAKLFRIYSPIN